MKILIDIKHPAQLNLFNALSRELLEDKWVDHPVLSQQRQTA